MNYLVVSFYKLVHIVNPASEVAWHHAFCRGHDLLGRIYFSEDGINAQFSGTHAAVKAYLEWVRQDDRFVDIDVKAQHYHEHAFPRMTIKVRPELVALGRQVDLEQRGEAVSAQQWRELLESDEEIVRLDVRNDYEWDIGHFKGFERPACETFRDFIDQAEQLAATHQPNKTKVMMCCTGGIRCEFYSALLREKGFEQVYQLDGGILRYAAEEQGKHWQGKLFVFDDRMSVDVDGEGQTGTCHRCGANCDKHYNCANMDCNALFLSCSECLQALKGCCQASCQEGERVRPLDHQCQGKPFRKWYRYFDVEQRACSANSD